MGFSILDVLESTELFIIFKLSLAVETSIISFVV